MSLHSYLLPVLVLGSLAAHAMAYGALRQPPHHVISVPDLVEMTLVEPPPPPPPAPVVEPPPAPTPAPVVPARAPRIATHRVAAPPPPSAAPPPAAPVSPADFTGTTLTNDGPGAGWASATGNGDTMTGPVGAPGARRGTEVRAGVPGGTGTAPVAHRAPAVVGLADLSRRPTAPDLDGALARNYPTAARSNGRAGRAVVRARIGADGRAHVVRVLSESEAGFGDACRRTLDGSRWQRALDRDGQEVATELSYTCRFEVAL